MGIIINFHKVNDPIWFEHILFFLKKKYNPISISDLVSCCQRKCDLKKLCHITVDDGDKSFYEVIFPVLKKHKIPATIFVSSDVAVNQLNFWFQEIVGYDRHNLIMVISEVINIKVKDLKHFPLIDIFRCLKIDQIWEIITRYQKKIKVDKKLCQNMSVNELKEVENSGLVTVGAHTLRHPILANEEIEISRNEITASISDLKKILGHEIKYFAYPNGLPGFDIGQREIRVLEENGCECALSTQSGPFNYHTDLLNMPRYGLSSGDKLIYFKTKLFFGSRWNTIMKLKPGNESVNRKKLLKLLRK